MGVLYRLSGTIKHKTGHSNAMESGGMMTRSKVLCSAVVGMVLAAGWLIGLGPSQTKAQASQAARLQGAQTKNPGAWPYADAYDEVAAAGETYRVRYEDEHIRLVEVGIVPGAQTSMHGDPYASIIAIDAPSPKIKNTALDPDSKMNGQSSQQAPPPQGLQYPIGRSEAPIAPHEVTNSDTFPLHYFKIEFKRVDGDDFATHWKSWYPWMLDPLRPWVNVDPRDPALGAPVSKEYPFAASTESFIAAPNNHYVRYEDDHVVFLEVCFRPGERENLHGHAYPSVFARDIGQSPAVSGPVPPSKNPPVQPAENLPGIGHAGAGGDWKLEPNGVNGQGGGNCAAPAGMKWPNCSTMGPQWPHAASDIAPYPSHFYRIQFKRIDGNGIRTHWREWYPWMANLAVQYKDKAAAAKSGN